MKNASSSSGARCCEVNIHDNAIRLHCVLADKYFVITNVNWLLFKGFDGCEARSRALQVVNRLSDNAFWVDCDVCCRVERKERSRLKNVKFQGKNVDGKGVSRSHSTC